MAESRLGVLRRNPAYRTYWLGQVVSLAGTWMQQVAAGFVVVTLTRSKETIGTLNFVASLPVIALLLFGGTVADRLDRRKILIATQLALAALAFAFAVLIASGEVRLWHVFVLSAALGVVLAFDLPAMQSLVPELVARPDIQNAVALNSAAFHGTRLIGPALAGAIMAAASSAWVFVANGASFFAVIASLLRIQTPPRPAPDPGAPPRRGLVEGLRYVHGHRTIRAVIAFVGLTTSCAFPFFTIFMPVFVVDSLGGDERWLGILMSTSGCGALVGALTLLRVPEPRRGGTMVAAAMAIASALALLSRASGVVVAMPCVLLLSFSVSLGLGVGTTLVQTTVPSELRGRVMGVHGLMFTGIMPVAALALGVVADAAGLRTTMLVMAGVYAATAIPLLLRARVGERG